MMGLTFRLFTQVCDSGPHGPPVIWLCHSHSVMPCGLTGFYQSCFFDLSLWVVLSCLYSDIFCWQELSAVCEINLI